MRDELASATELRRSRLTAADEPLRRSKPQRSAVVWVTLALSLFYVFLFAFSTYELARHYGLRKTAEWAARPTPDGWVVSVVDPKGAAAGVLHVGDRLVAI
ncbi:MAG: hypothetical protein ACRD2N_01245 [Vicinamibacterales bacterium]